MLSPKSKIELVPVGTHNRASEGGLKTHLSPSGTLAPLCGASHPAIGLIPGVEPIDREWLAHDIAGELCQTCRKAALKLLQDEDPSDGTQSPD